MLFVYEFSTELIGRSSSFSWSKKILPEICSLVAVFLTNVLIIYLINGLIINEIFMLAHYKTFPESVGTNGAYPKAS